MTKNTNNPKKPRYYCPKCEKTYVNKSPLYKHVIKCMGKDDAYMMEITEHTIFKLKN